MFHVRNLHLGHVAKSFALREAPAAVTGKKKKRSKDLSKAKGSQKRSLRKRAATNSNTALEFQIGNAQVLQQARLPVEESGSYFT